MLAKKNPNYNSILNHIFLSDFFFCFLHFFVIIISILYAYYVWVQHTWRRLWFSLILFKFFCPISSNFILVLYLYKKDSDFMVNLTRFFVAFFHLYFLCISENCYQFVLQSQLAGLIFAHPFLQEHYKILSNNRYIIFSLLC